MKCSMDAQWPHFTNVSPAHTNNARSEVRFCDNTIIIFVGLVEGAAASKGLRLRPLDAWQSIQCIGHTTLVFELQGVWSWESEASS